MSKLHPCLLLVARSHSDDPESLKLCGNNSKNQNSEVKCLENAEKGQDPVCVLELNDNNHLIWKDAEYKAKKFNRLIL